MFRETMALLPVMLILDPSSLSTMLHPVTVAELPCTWMTLSSHRREATFFTTAPSPMISMPSVSSPNSEQESTKFEFPVILRNRPLGRPREEHLLTLQSLPVSWTCATPPAPARKMKPCTDTRLPVEIRHAAAAPFASVPSHTVDFPMNCRFGMLEVTFS